jgi:CheY-like chemotaxis protein
MENRINTLLIDDRQSRLKAISKMLEECNFSVHKVLYTGEKSINDITSNEYDICLVDIILKDNDEKRMDSGNLESVQFVKKIIEKEKINKQTIICFYTTGVTVHDEVTLLKQFESISVMLIGSRHIFLENNEFRESALGKIKRKEYCDSIKKIAKEKNDK